MSKLDFCGFVASLENGNFGKVDFCDPLFAGALDCLARRLSFEAAESGLPEACESLGNLRAAIAKKHGNSLSKENSPFCQLLTSLQRGGNE